jgi:hypothetical protein
MFVIDLSTVDGWNQNVEHEVMQADEVLDVDKSQMALTEVGKHLRLLEEVIEDSGGASRQPKVHSISILIGVRR